MLVNYAGFAQVGAIEESSIADVQAQFDTNLLGVLRVIKAVLPVMRQQGSGRIINVSSVVGQVAPPYMGPETSVLLSLLPAEPDYITAALCS